MPYVGEIANHESLRRIRESQAVRELENRFRLKNISSADIIKNQFLSSNDLPDSNNNIHYVITIDGSNLSISPEKGYPGAEYCYLTVASVILDMQIIKTTSQERFPDPIKLRGAKKTTSFEGVLPGCNVLLDNESDDKSSLRRVLFETLQKHTLFTEGETLLETYEYLLKYRIENAGSKPKSPISGFEDRDLEYGFGVYQCKYSGCDLFSTDAMRLHELLNPVGSSGEMYNQIMSVIEKLTLINILRNFEKMGWLYLLRHTAFVIDGPLAVFSVASWLAGAISKELERINNKQKQSSGQDMLILGIEKTGLFATHFEQLDRVTGRDYTFGEGAIAPNSILLLNDDYIKKHIKPSISEKPYGQDTYFGRKILYKTKLGHRIVPVLCCFNDNQRNITTCEINQFSRLKDVTTLLDELSSNRYANSISALIAAHAEAAIPLNLGTKIFEKMAKEFKKESINNV